MAHLEIRIADTDDVSTIEKLYNSVIGSDGCTWNEDYPSRNEIQNDIKAECLFIAEIGSEAVGAVSVVPENELDGLSFWRVNELNQREIARVAVSPEHQGHGYAKIMILYVLDFLKRNGTPAVHLLVAKNNKTAQHIYESLGFEFVDECSMYGLDFYACEKKLTQ